MRPRTNFQIRFWFWNVQPFEEDTGHFIIIILSRMHQDLLMLFAQHAADCGSFDELRPRAYDGQNSHVVTARPFLLASCLAREGLRYSANSRGTGCQKSPA